MTPTQIPLRIDFAGGWLDVPKYAIPGAYVVNCAISPLVWLVAFSGDTVADDRFMAWDSGNGVPFSQGVPEGAGIGGSTAWRILNGLDVDAMEAAQGCGWQDAAVIRQTGLCVWASGPEPVLVQHDRGDWLKGRMALYWTGKKHDSAKLSGMARDYNAIANASVGAMQAVQRQDLDLLAGAVDMSYEQQLSEGMEPLPIFGMACKYCGAGWGGYAVYLFENEAYRDHAVKERGLMAVEPYAK